MNPMSEKPNPVMLRSAAVAGVVGVLLAAVGAGDLPDVEPDVLIDVRNAHELIHARVAEDAVEDEGRRRWCSCIRR